VSSVDITWMDLVLRGSDLAPLGRLVQIIVCFGGFVVLRITSTPAGGDGGVCLWLDPTQVLI